MTTNTAVSIERSIALVTEVFDGIFATIDAWRDLVEERLAGGVPLTAAALDPLAASFALPAVSTDTLLTGAGLVAAPGALADAAWHLAWWLRDAPEPRRLATVDDPSHDAFRDYTELEWWRVPTRTGVRHLTGPYVDYVCTEDYTVTITTPVRLEGRLVAMIGADALVDRLERELLPALRAAGPDAALVNPSGRIVTATGAGREPGAILRLEGLAEALASRSSGAALPGGTVMPGGAALPGGTVLPGGAVLHVCGDTELTLVLDAGH